MPIYDYRCTACSSRFEFLQTRHGDPAPPCPQCGGGQVERLPSAFAVATAPGSAATVGPCGASNCACRQGGAETTS